MYTSSLVLEHLKAIRGENRKTHDELRELKARMTAAETVVAASVTADTRMQHSIDRLSDRVEHIERHLRPGW